jgi:LmbE family N-acetylglucosaminyl deacetylase
VNKFGSALIRKDAISLIEYHTVSTINCWKPNVFINISDVYKHKLNALNEFKSQINKSYFTKDTLDSFHSNFQSRKRGVKIVEQFKILEMFGE